MNQSHLECLNKKCNLKSCRVFIRYQSNLKVIADKWGQKLKMLEVQLQKQVILSQTSMWLMIKQLHWQQCKKLWNEDNQKKIPQSQDWTNKISNRSKRKFKFTLLTKQTKSALITMLNMKELTELLTIELHKKWKKQAKLHQELLKKLRRT